jgi:hypothetical protein
MRTIYAKPLNAVDATTNPNSTPVNLENMSGFSVTAICTSSATGTGKLQCHNGRSVIGDGSDLPASGWVDVAGSSQTVSSTAATWNVTNAFYRWMRVAYSNSSGTGTITAEVTGKAPTAP